jgi:hypothetical protein
LESALRDAFRRDHSASKRTAPHRIPLGLLLLSRHHISAEQLRSALDAQRSAGHGRIGEWLREFGFVGEEQVTAALARQWSCPVLLETSGQHRSGAFPQIPLILLERFRMIEIDYVASSATLYIAFAEGVDHGVLYAIEQMTGCHTEPCMTLPRRVRARLQELAIRRAENEVVFDRVSDHAEVCRIIRSYCARLRASEIRFANCGPFYWVRLLRPSRPPHDLLVRSPQPPSCEVGFMS